ncbi:hypothetical protein FQA39_LY12657 [Lamprigera yunnana]|nr:hypothetical protein FQA39_LY12657 [Lamprigera yunnana]
MIVILIETIGRRALIEIHSKDLSKLLTLIYYDFWPSNIADEATHKNVTKKSNIFFTFFMSYTIVGSFCMMQTVIFASVAGIKPFFTLYPQPLETSPYYECVYVLETYLSLDVSFTTNGTDIILMSLLFICTAQFEIISSYFKVNFEKLLLLSDEDERGQKAKNLLFECIEKHNMLLESCKILDKPYGDFMFCRFMTAVGAICLSIFIVNFQPENMLTGVTYFLAHMVEIFIYCFLGNEIIIQSSKLSEVVFHCGWHLLTTTKDKEIQKALSMMILRSQKPTSISIGGFGSLTLEIYIKLVKFSFSIYTVLSKVVSRTD